MFKYKVTILYDRASCGEIVFVIEYPKLPNCKTWEEETIGDEIFWKVETSLGYVFARKNFVYGILVEKIE